MIAILSLLHFAAFPPPPQFLQIKKSAYVATFALNYGTMAFMNVYTLPLVASWGADTQK